MPLTPEQRERVMSEFRQLGTAMNLTADQKQKVQDFLTGAYDKLQEYGQQHSTASREEITRRVADQRAILRQQLVILLSPDQLAKWDAEVEKIKDFLFLKMAAGASA